MQTGRAMYLKQIPHFVGKIGHSCPQGQGVLLSAFLLMATRRNLGTRVILSAV